MNEKLPLKKQMQGLPAEHPRRIAYNFARWREAMELSHAMLIDQADVQERFALHKDDLNRKYLDHWGKRVGVRSELKTAIERFESQ
ncbi:hypothetical protein Enr13x_71140 [Stieleria neptunia]|uniref:Uncharacterized protein n=1 Tax=Stieleria neptunia TaxID=2527979 RepID=A0A518I271_9BACT|nr:hypothetical protein [Stieleria neptunia]QDV47205.1 hypothetical protein Enr13x_71140 [Stieleria neptunia]